MPDTVLSPGDTALKGRDGGQTKKPRIIAQHALFYLTGTHRAPADSGGSGDYPRVNGSSEFSIA